MTNSPATRGFLFADLRGYTRFVETHGDEAAARLLRAYRTLMRDVIARFGAAEIKTEGDSFYIVFASASTAIEGGRAILNAASEATTRDPGLPIHVGIGVHAGETEDTGEGPVGLAVNIAARVCAQARPGELLVTDTVRSLTRTRMTVHFVPRGSPKLKGIAEPIPLYAVVTDAQAAGPAARVNRFVIAGGAAVLGLAVVALVLVLANASKAPSAEPAGLPCAPPSATVAPIADVPAYRADFSRTSVYPGPGPQCQPIVAWQRQLGAVPNFVPIVVKGEVVVGDQSGLHAYDGATGKPIWTFAGSGGFSESAVADQDAIFAADLGGTLHSIDARTGSERWKRPLPNAGIDPTSGSGLIWVGSSDGHALGLDPSTGATRWQWDTPGGKAATVGLVTDKAAYVVSGGTLYAIRLVDKAELWHFATAAQKLSVPVLSAGTMYIAELPSEDGAAGALVALDEKTGANRWRPFAIASGKQVTPGPVLDHVVYVTTDGDGVYALRDKGSDYGVVWHNSQVSTSFRPASLAGNVLYVQQNESTLVALRSDNGQLAWRTPTADKGEEAPVVTGGLVYQVDSEEGALRAWAEPGLSAKLGAATASASPAPSGPPVPNPFAVVATFPWFETGIQVPAAMDVGPDGLLYVLSAKADFSEPKVTVIDPKTGRPVRSWGQYGSGPGELDLTGSSSNGPSGCIQVSSDGLVYVGERENRRVEVFTREGKFVRVIGAGQLHLLLFCELGPDGSLYTSGDETGVISKFSPSGKLVWQRLVDPFRTNYSFQVHGIVFRPDGKLLGFTDGTGQALSLDPANGRVVSHWGEPGDAPGQLGLSGEPSLDPKGNIYVFQYVPQAVQVFDPTGRFLGGIYEDSTSEESGSQYLGKVFWPAPVFAADGYAYSFGPDGLIRLKVTLPGR